MMKNVNVILISALIISIFLNLFFFLASNRVLKEGVNTSIEQNADIELPNPDIIEGSGGTLDDIIETDAILDEYVYQRDIVQSYIAGNTGVVFENIQKALGYSRDIVYPVEVPQQLSQDLFFQFIDSLDQCDSLDATFAKDELQQTCRYDYYVKQILTSNSDITIPEGFLKSHNLLRNISQGTCDIQDNYLCILLNPQDKVLSRAEFVEQSGEFFASNNLTVSDVPFYSFGFYVFQEDIEKISTIEDISNIYYDKALVYKAVSKNDIGVCGQILNQSFISYCQDYFSQDKRDKYEAIFTSFYSGLKERK